MSVAVLSCFWCALKWPISTTRTSIAELSRNYRGTIAELLRNSPKLRPTQGLLHYLSPHFAIAFPFSFRYPLFFWPEGRLMVYYLPSVSLTLRNSPLFRYSIAK